MIFASGIFGTPKRGAALAIIAARRSPSPTRASENQTAGGNNSASPDLQTLGAGAELSADLEHFGPAVMIFATHRRLLHAR